MCVGCPSPWQCQVEASAAREASGFVLARGVVYAQTSTVWKASIFLDFSSSRSWRVVSPSPALITLVLGLMGSVFSCGEFVWSRAWVSASTAQLSCNLIKCRCSTVAFLDRVALSFRCRFPLQHGHFSFCHHTRLLVSLQVRNSL
ncbi:unnamed protein product [Brassica oleracea var. botrytis]